MDHPKSLIALLLLLFTCLGFASGISSHLMETTENDLIEWCQMDSLSSNETEDEKMYCYYSFYTKDGVSMYCGKSPPDTSSIAKCSDSVGKNKTICKVKIIFFRKWRGQKFVPPTRYGVTPRIVRKNCPAGALYYVLGVGESDFVHDVSDGSTLVFGEKKTLSANIYSSNMTIVQMVDLLERFFSDSFSIGLLYMNQVESLGWLKWSKFTELKYFLMDGMTKFSHIGTEEVVLDEMFKNFTIAKTNVILKERSIIIKNPRCRDSNLLISLKTTPLVMEAVNPIQIQNTVFECSVNRTKSEILIQLNRPLEPMPSEIFKKLLDDSLLELKHNKILRLEVDPIDCCDPINRWLFNQTVNYTQFIRSSCSATGGIPALDFYYHINNSTASCSGYTGPISRKISSKLTNILIIVCIAVIVLVIVIVTYMLLKKDSDTKPKLHPVGSAGRKSDSKQSGSKMTRRKGSKSHESEKKIKSNSLQRLKSQDKQRLSQKSDGTLLAQTDSSAALSPSYPKFVRLKSP